MKQNDLITLHSNNLSLSQRTCFLFGDIDNGTAAELCKNIIALDIISDSDITIFLNTDGGCVYSGMAIYDTIKTCRSKVTVVGCGHLFSMGTVILQAADVRLLQANCELMLHYGTVALDDTNENDFIKMAESSKRSQKILVDIYHKRSGLHKNKIHKMLSFDTYLSATEAVKLNLADEVMENDGT